MSLQFLSVLVQQRKGDRLFVWKIVIERANRRAAPFGNCGHRGGFIAYLHKQFCGGIQKAREWKSEGSSIDSKGAEEPGHDRCLDRLRHEKGGGCRFEAGRYSTPEGHWVIADLNGKGGHIRTVPMPDWVKRAIDEWTVPAGLTSGPLFRAINKAGRTWGNGFTPKVIWSIVREGAASCGLTGIAPHDLRRTCARLCHQAGGELEQIQFLLGHVSIETTERYLGCKQRFQNAVNDAIGLEPDGS
jgi:hypothetical protein